MQHAELAPLHLLSSLVADEGDDPQFGARPLKRVIQHKLENPIATGILQDNYEAVDTIGVGYSGEELTFTKVDGTPLPTA